MDGRTDGRTDGWMDGWIPENKSSANIFNSLNNKCVAVLALLHLDVSGSSPKSLL